MKSYRVLAWKELLAQKVTFIFVIMPDRSPAFLLDFLWYALRHKR